jgi:hypothetical protein
MKRGVTRVKQVCAQGGAAALAMRRNCAATLPAGVIRKIRAVRRTGVAAPPPTRPGL